MVFFLLWEEKMIELLNMMVYGVAITLGIFAVLFLVGTGFAIYIIHKVWKGIKDDEKSKI